VTDKFAKLKHIGTNKAFNPTGEDKPMSAKLSHSQFKVLAMIASFQGEGGLCDSSLGQLAEATGMTEKTVSKAVWELNEFQYDEKQVLIVTEGEFKNRKKLYFHLLPNPLFSVYGETDTVKITVSSEADTVNSSVTSEVDTVRITDSIELKDSKELKDIKNIDLEESRMKNKEVIQSFCEAYEKKTTSSFKIVWSRDNKFTTQFLKTVQDLRNDEIKKLIEIIVENYDKWSTNTAKFPLSIMSLKTEWIQNKARDLLKIEKESLSQIETQSVEATKKNVSSISRILQRKRGSN
jgi:hypothetical protein